MFYTSMVPSLEMGFVEISFSQLNEMLLNSDFIPNNHIVTCEVHIKTW